MRSSTTSKKGILFDNYLPKPVQLEKKSLNLNRKHSEKLIKQQTTESIINEKNNSFGEVLLGKKTTSINIVIKEPPPRETLPRKIYIPRSEKNLKFENYTPRKDWFDGASLTSNINYDIDFKQVYTQQGSGVCFKKVKGREQMTRYGRPLAPLVQSTIEPVLTERK